MYIIIKGSCSHIFHSSQCKSALNSLTTYCEKERGKVVQIFPKDKFMSLRISEFLPTYWEILVCCVEEHFEFCKIFFSSNNWSSCVLCPEGVMSHGNKIIPGTRESFRILNFHCFLWGFSDSVTSVLRFQMYVLGWVKFGKCFCV